MNYKYKKIPIIIFSLALFSLAVVPYAFASQIIITPSSNSVGIGEQFYVDISVNPEGESMNGIEGSITFPKDNLSFIRAENGKSIINTWIESPALNGNNIISFAGIVPNGFNGLIDPFNDGHLLPGQIVRLIFEGNKSGTGLITVSSISLTKNDGLGTLENIPVIESFITITNKNNPFIYQTSDSQQPDLNAEVIRDINLFNYKYALIFKADDKETGIKSVMIKEGSDDWKEAESPYLLKDQSRRSIIKVQATDFSGNITTIQIEPLPEKNYLYIIVIFIVLVLCSVSFIIFRKKHAHKK